MCAWGGPWPTHVCAMTLTSAHCAQRLVVLDPFQVRRKYLLSKALRCESYPLRQPT